MVCIDIFRKKYVPVVVSTLKKQIWLLLPVVLMYNIKNIGVFLFILSAGLLFFTACDSVTTNEPEVSEPSNNNDNDSGWLIPFEQVYVGAGRDGIPSIDDPKFSDVSEIDFMNPDDLVIGVKMDNEIKAYPHKILNYHEIVNDRIADVPVSVTFCPLTGSGLVWNRVIDGRETTFGVSGLIFKNNLIAYDRDTESFWSQMKAMGVHGEKRGDVPESYHLVEMTWKSWKETFPGSRVLSGKTGFDRNYDSYPYGRNYHNDNKNILFPIEREDERLERKTLGHGIFYNSTLHVFPIDKFPEEIKVLNRNINGNNIVIAGSSKHRLVVAFYRQADDNTLYEFTAISDDFPIIMEDNRGNRWNIFGEAVSGPDQGRMLRSAPSYNAYWFAWADFFGFGNKEPKIVIP